MEKERLYKITINEWCGDNAVYTKSCEVATVTIKSKSADGAIKKALEKVEGEIESESLFASAVECIGILRL